MPAIKDQEIRAEKTPRLLWEGSGGLRLAALPRWIQIRLLPGLILGLALTLGCGGQRMVVVVEEIPESPVPSRIPSPRPSPSPSPSPSSAPEPSPASPSPFSQPSKPQTWSLGIQVEWEESFHPLLIGEVASRGRSRVLTDVLSDDGYGLRGTFKNLDPGPYRIRVWQPAVPNVALVDNTVLLDGNYLESIRPHLVQFEIAPERSFEVERDIAITLVSEPSRRPVFSSRPLATLFTEGLDGARHPRSVLLAAGQYSYSLKDIGPEVNVGFIGMPDGTDPVMSENLFEVTAVERGAIVNLTPLIRTVAYDPGRDAPPKER